MRGPEHVVELFHGYTYSAHPLACAAALATLDLYRDEDLFARARRLEPTWAEAAMGLKNLPNVLDIRTLGLTAAIDLASRPDAAGRRAYDAMVQAFDAESLVIRVTGDTIALTPPLIVSEGEIADMFERVARVIRAVAS
jgi:beta-alanine--pyruvate transaminase